MKNQYNPIATGLSAFSQYQNSVFEPIRKLVKREYREPKIIYLFLSLLFFFFAYINSKFIFFDEHFVNFLYPVSILLFILFLNVFRVQRKKIEEIISDVKTRIDFQTEKQKLVDTFNDLGIDLNDAKSVIKIVDDMNNQEDLDFVLKFYVPAIRALDYEFYVSRWKGSEDSFIELRYKKLRRLKKLSTVGKISDMGQHSK
ncbi:MAG: hypothetical protein NT068_00790 [Candidatus Nomurabacteria bacterium]|nr:hypothetical protein [Candidatus Nomurabacteria bacterium]